MRTYLLLAGLLFISYQQAAAQRACTATEYLQRALLNNPSLSDQVNSIESFIKAKQSENTAVDGTGRVQHGVIKIPVVVHILYHVPGENISDERVLSQIEVLNKCFRLLNADSVNIPDAFKPYAADCEFEFQLATSDPQRRSTTGIIRKYTPVAEWVMDDKMKFSSQTGDDAWDPQSYLNIWVCNLRRMAGYASVVGDDPAKDGIVVHYNYFGVNSAPGYEMGKTAVHETGHWLGLKHIWGDAYCGDDEVDDTPKQSVATPGCPSGIRVSCNNSAAGDMYMNYMDYTDDRCINLFTEGQKARMRTLFDAGGPRYALRHSKGLSEPLIVESPLPPEELPRWLQPQVYPNPAHTQLTIDLSYDSRWIGKTLTIYDVNGRPVMHVLITTKVQVINIRLLRAGVYFMSAQKEDGSYIKQKFIKM